MNRRSLTVACALWPIAALAACSPPAPDSTADAANKPDPAHSAPLAWSEQVLPRDCIDLTVRGSDARQLDPTLLSQLMSDASASGHPVRPYKVLPSSTGKEYFVVMSSERYSDTYVVYVTPSPGATPTRKFMMGNMHYGGDCASRAPGG
jgi:hypothetical protein